MREILDQTAKAAQLQWGRSTSLRKTLSPQRPTTILDTLQWGRSTSLRKTWWPRLSCVAIPLASMGPQHIAAENEMLSVNRRFHVHASMGPQHIAAENRKFFPLPLDYVSGFNGAAAHRCGKPCRCSSCRLPVVGFNGAAAHRCGKRALLSRHGDRAWRRFNGAAAHRCGKRSVAAGAIKRSGGLQWGRSTSLRKTCLSCGIRTSGVIRLQWGRSTSLRKTWTRLPGEPGFPVLQWGRSTSLRKTSPTASPSASPTSASMGPQHIAAENCGLVVV